MSNIPMFLQHMNCFDGRPSDDTTREYLIQFYKHKNKDVRFGTCEQCGKTFVRKQIRSRFCSIKCSSQYKKTSHYNRI